MAQDSGIFRPDFDFKTSLWLYRMGMHETLRMRGVTDLEMAQLKASLRVVRDLDSEFPSPSAKYAMKVVRDIASKGDELGILDGN